MSIINDTADLGRHQLQPITDHQARTGAAPSGNAALRRTLRQSDFGALLVAWGVAVAIGGAPPEELLGRFGVALAFALAGYALIARHGLHLARVATMRTVEHTLIVRVCGLLFAAGALEHLAGPVAINGATLVIGSILSVVLLITGRTVYRAWLAGARSAGRFTHKVVIVGADPAGQELRLSLDDHPELGYDVVGVIGSRYQASRNGLEDLWIGAAEHTAELVAASGASGAIISSSAFDSDTINQLTQELLAGGHHVHLNTGISGIDQRRLRSVHVGYEPLLYVERVKISRVQLWAKTALDMTLAALMTVLTAPIILVSALAIKLEDRGPVIFRQQRVGRDGVPFQVLKLRTMRVNAESELDALREHNDRSGPLFKLHADPRVTRVGGVLRALSIDELPQLWNVLKGDMSLVGPRPALPSEAAEFTARLQDRTRVLPGITGLWQVEARDNPSFRAYERLDLFYVDNWSIGLDVMILIATAESELSRVLRRVMGKGDDVIESDGAPAVVAPLTEASSDGTSDPEWAMSPRLVHASQATANAR